MRFGSRICWERECDLLYRQQTRCYLWSEVLFCFVMRAGWIAQMKSSCIGLVPYTILVSIYLFIFTKWFLLWCPVCYVAVQG